MADTNFEIYYRKKGSDRWMMDSRYGTTSKQEALDDAKELERQPDIDAVRVVREIHDQESGNTRDTVIYTSSKLKNKGGGGDAGPKRGHDDDDDDGPAPPRRAAPMRLSPVAAAATTDDDEEDEDEAPKKSWFKRKATGGGEGEDGDKAPAKISGFRAYMVVMKMVILVFVSFGIATATTLIYERFLA